MLDTNILLAYLRGARRNPLSLLLADARRDSVNLVVPKVVVEEAVNKRREALVEATKALQDAVEHIERLDATPPTIGPFDVDDQVRRFRRGIERLLISSERRDYPDTSHEEIVQRDLSRRKPFRASGKGYRDALLWETVLEVVRESRQLDEVRKGGTDQIVLLTNDGDFAEGGRLAPDLQDDLERVGAPRDYVRLVTDLQAFNDEFISEATIIQEDLRGLLESESPQRAEVERLLKQQLSPYVIDDFDVRSADPRDFEDGSDIEEIQLDAATVVEPYDVHRVWLVRADPLDADVVLFDVEAELDADVDVDLEVLREISPWEREDDEPRQRRERRTTTVTRTLTISAEGRYRPSSGTFEEIHVYHVSI